MEIYLTDDAFAGMVQQMTATAVAIFENEDLPTEPAEVRAPLGIRQRLGLKQPNPSYTVEGVRFAVGIRGMEGVAFQHDGNIQIAVKVAFGRQPVHYEVYSIEKYVYHWITDNRRSSAEHSRERFAEAQWHLEHHLANH